MNTKKKAAPKKAAKKKADSNVVNAEFFETQDPKYVIIGGMLCNAFTKEPIPEDEPVFILRAKDVHAYGALDHYEDLCRDQEHRESIAVRMLEFDEFRAGNPDRMNEPDTMTAIPDNTDGKK